MFGGRFRTSTIALMVAFVLTFGLYQVYKPTPPPAQAPSSNVVPPGFVPDPDYTWVPRTNVQEPRRTPTTTPTTTTTAPTETTSPTDTSASTSSGTPTSAPTSPTSTTPAPPGVPPSPLPGPGPTVPPSR
jgi:hypothetical protein